MATGNGFFKKDEAAVPGKKRDRVSCILYGCVALLALLAMGMIVFAMRLLGGGTDAPAAATPSPSARQDQALAAPEDWLPQHLAIANPPPEAVLTN